MPCPRLFYTLRIASALPQDIPELQISSFPEGIAPPSPSVVGNITAFGHTPAQQPAVGGALVSRLSWSIVCHLSEDDAAQLGALYAWQQRQIREGSDATLEWIDRFEPTEPEPLASLSRDIIDAQTTAYGLTYGSPVVKCIISKPTRSLLARRGAVATRLCSFTVEEFR